MRVDAGRLARLEERRRRKLRRKYEAKQNSELSKLLPQKGGEPTEFEIQSFLYHELRAMGFEVRGEQATKCGTAVFDLLLFKNGKPARVVEVKKHLAALLRSPLKRPNKAVAAQCARYAEFGCPVDLVCGMREAKAYIASASSLDLTTNTH